MTSEPHIVDARYVQLVNYCSLMSKDLDNQAHSEFQGLTKEMIDANIRTFCSVLQETESYRQTLVYYHQHNVPF